MNGKFDVTKGGALRAKQAAEFLCISRSSFWRWVSEGRIPKGKKLTSRCTVWLKSDIEKILCEGGE